MRFYPTTLPNYLSPATGNRSGRKRPLLNCRRARSTKRRVLCAEYQFQTGLPAASLIWDFHEPSTNFTTLSGIGT